MEFCITLVRCNQVCIKRNVFKMEGFFQNKTHVYFFEMEMIVWILPDLLCRWPFWN